MYKNLSAKYYQENKERLQKKARERYQNLSKEGKFKKMKKIKWWSIEKNIIEWERTLYYNYKKYFNLENFASL